MCPLSSLGVRPPSQDFLSHLFQLCQRHRVRFSRSVPRPHPPRRIWDSGAQWRGQPNGGVPRPQCDRCGRCSLPGRRPGAAPRVGPRGSGPGEAGHAARATVPGMADGHDVCPTRVAQGGRLFLLMGTIASPIIAANVPVPVGLCCHLSPSATTQYARPLRPKEPTMGQVPTGRGHLKSASFSWVCHNE
jgi:hypothetical protein